MKKLGYLLSVFIIFSSFTCDNEPLDNDFTNTDPTSGSQAIVGEWTAVTFETFADVSAEFIGITINTENDIIGQNMDYNVTFGVGTFTTNGSYDLLVTATVDGQDPVTNTSSVENVSGSGEYSVTGNTITFSDSFFDVEIDGVDDSLSSGPQTAQYSISTDGETLTITQNEQQTFSENGVSSTIEISSTSVWQRVN